jgi:tripartite-type tricarboxylate transporter receptor subunit TctC
MLPATQAGRSQDGAREEQIMAWLRIALTALAILCTAAHAQSPADFYRGRTIDLYIGYSVGGGYDVYARLIARHIGKHIPGNPTVVPKNMEGAGSLRLANWIAQVAPRDGTVFGAVSRGAPFDPLLGQKAAQFSGTDFTWVGSANNEVSLCVASDTAPVATFEDVRSKELTVGSTGAADDTAQFPKVLNAVLGTRFKIITGYPGGNEVSLAIERGEVQGRCGWSWSSIKATHERWVTSGKIRLLVQLALERHPDLPKVPLITELAKTDEQRQLLKLIFARQVVGRPYLAPPGLPADRADALRQAFTATMNDPEFRADAEKSKLEINPVAGDRVDALVREIYRTPAAVTQHAAAILN